MLYFRIIIHYSTSVLKSQLQHFRIWWKVVFCHCFFYCVTIFDI